MIRKLLSITTLSLIVAWLTHPVLAQSTQAQSGQTTFGIKAGINVANQSSELYNIITSVGGEQQSRKGLIIGGFVSFPRNTRDFYVQPEVYFVQKGTEIIAGQLADSLETINLKLNYIEIPVIWKYVLGHEDFRPALYGGPVASFLLSAKEGDRDVKDEYNSLDVGFSGGFTLMFGKIGIDARFTFGFLNVGNFRGTDLETADVSINNNTFSIMGVYEF